MYGAMKRFLDNDSGATAIEYGLIGAGLALALIAMLAVLGGELRNSFNTSARTSAHASDKAPK